MNRETDTCSECILNCMLHCRKESSHSPVVSSFFKVMFGKQFSNFLIVPPKFARTISSLVGKKTYLEDSSGKQWQVVVSKVSGAIAFIDGWYKFSQDHGIELGDFLVFHYVKESHFIVQIYGRSACEKSTICGDKFYNNKRTKIIHNPATGSGRYVSSGKEPPPMLDYSNPCDDSPPHDGAIRIQNDHSSDDARNSQWVERNVPTPKNNITKTNKAWTSDFSLDPCSIIGRDIGASKEDEIRCLNDLSIFEMPSSRVVEKDTSSQAVSMLGKEEIRAASFDAKYAHSTRENTPSKHEEASLIKKEHSLLLSSHPRANVPLDFNIPKQPVEMPSNFEFPSMPGGSTRQVKQEPKDYSVSFGSNAKADTSLGVSLQNANIPIIEKNGGKYSGNVNLILQHDGHSNIIVKPEPVDFADVSAASVVKVTCAVQPNNESFLELPEHLPTAVHPGARLRKLVFLRDPARRLWPVVYHQRYGLKVLASGWDSFKKANNIQPGDQCTFSVEDLDEGFFAVQILRG